MNSLPETGNANPLGLHDDKTVLQFPSVPACQPHHILSEISTRLSRIPEKDNASPNRHGSETKLAEILILGQKNPSLPHASSDYLFVLCPRGDLRNGNHLMAGQPESNDNTKVATLIG